MNKIIELSDFNHPDLDMYARLSEVDLRRFYEPEPGLFIAESPKVIERALNAGYEPVSFLVEQKDLTGEAAPIISHYTDTPIFTAEYNILVQLTGYALTRGMLCVMKRKTLPEAANIIADRKRIVILDDVVNPTNIGSIFRSAAALNMDGILLTPGCSDPLYRRASRVSMGTVFQIPWTRLKSENNKENPSLFSLLKSHGFKTIAMAITNDSGSINHPALLAEEKLAIILGNEGDGLSIETIMACDYRVKIPMAHDVDSLNVAAASTIAFWELGKH